MMNTPVKIISPLSFDARGCLTFVGYNLRYITRYPSLDLRRKPLLLCPLAQSKLRLRAIIMCQSWLATAPLVASTCSPLSHVSPSFSFSFSCSDTWFTQAYRAARESSSSSRSVRWDEGKDKAKFASGSSYFPSRALPDLCASQLKRFHWPQMVVNFGENCIFFNFCILGEKICFFRRYVIKFCSGELLNDYE